MRDDQINRLHEISVKREMLLLRQFDFLNTRIQAYEYVLSSPWRILRAIISHRWLKRTVDERQQELLKKYEQAMERAMGKPHLVVAGNGNG